MRPPTLARPRPRIAGQKEGEPKIVAGPGTRVQAAFFFEPDFAFGFESDLVFGLLFDSEESLELLSFDEEPLSLESEEPLSLESEELLSLESLELSSFFVLEYASAYQPPPFRTKDVREISFLTLRERHWGQVFTGSSVMRCSRSNSCSHFSQAYS
jgi:hypothetical protein